jgi:type II secretory pathway pseudopilin PulG
LATSLLELLAVIALLGIFATAVMSRYGRDLLGNTGIRSKASELSLSLLQAQRTAIKTGIPHGVLFRGSTSKVESWSVMRFENDGSQYLVDEVAPLTDDLQLSVSSDRIVFDFEGNGTSELQAKLTGPDRSWQVSVLPLTRMIDSHELK